jgi:hypothetical protein
MNTNILNRSAVKKYALEMSKQYRNGKFTRVSQEFLADIETEAEVAIRSLAYESPTATAGDFVTRFSLERAREKLNTHLSGLIEKKVRRHPTLGVTLKD